MSDFEAILAEIKKGHRLGLRLDEKQSTLARLSGSPEIERLISELDLLDDPDLEDEGGELSDENRAVRQALTQVLARIGEKAIAPLIKALNSPNPQTREHVATALGEMRASAALESLTRHPQTETSNAARRGIIYALGRIKDPCFVEALLSILPSKGPTKDRWLVRRVANALGDIGGERALQRLRELYLENSDWFSRLGAVEGLSRINDPIAHNLLHEAINDPDKWVRRAAQAALQGTENPK